MRVKVVIFDLDGTLLDTESLVVEVSKTVLAKYGKQLTLAAQAASTGKKPLDAWQATIEELGLEGVTAQQLFDESEPLLKARWHETGLMPGAGRLVEHLKAHKVPVAVATSSLRGNFERKMSGPSAASMRLHFQAVTCGDDVENGKPAPDCFLSIANEVGFEPADCLVIEDAPSGVHAATAAGMKVVAVPSVPDKSAYPEPSPGSSTGCVEILPSLLDFRPERYGLPPFEDLVQGVVPLQPPWRLKGPVVKGFGRGSRELGIPTANLDAVALQGSLAEAVTGIYCGFASVGASDEVFKMCMSIGWNPFYKNQQKTVEPWILHSFSADFYREELRLVVCGYIRPEASFDSLDALVQRIHEDGRVSKGALENAPFAQLEWYLKFAPWHCSANFAVTKHDVLQHTHFRSFSPYLSCEEFVCSAARPAAAASCRGVQKLGGPP